MHLLAGTQAITHRTIACLDARIDQRDSRLLSCRRHHVEQVGEADLARQSLDRAECRRQIQPIGPEDAIAADIGTGPADMPLAGHAASDIGDHAERQRRQFLRLQSRPEAQVRHGQVGMPLPAAQVVRNIGARHRGTLARHLQRAGRGDSAILHRQGKVRHGQRVEAHRRLRIAHLHRRLERQRPLGKGPAARPLFDDQWHGANPSARALDVAGKTILRRRTGDAHRRQAHRRILRADGEIGVAQGEAGLAQYQTGIVRLEPHRAVTASPVQRDIAKLRTALHTARPHGEERRIGQRAECLPGLPQREAAIARFQQGQWRAMFVDRDRAIGRQPAIDRQAKTANSPIGQRPIQPQSRREAGIALRPGNESDRLERQPGAVGRIGIDEQLPAKTAAGAAGQSERRLGQAAALRRDRAVQRPVDRCAALARPGQRHPTIARHGHLRAAARCKFGIGQDQTAGIALLRQRHPRPQQIIRPGPPGCIRQPQGQRRHRRASRRRAQSRQRIAPGHPPVPRGQIAAEGRITAAQRPVTGQFGRPRQHPGTGKGACADPRTPGHGPGRTVELDPTDRGRQQHALRLERLARQLGRSVPAVQPLAQPQIDLGRRRSHRHVRAGERIALDRPAQVRPAVHHRHIQPGAGPGHATAGHPCPGHGSGQLAAETRFQIAIAIDLHADRTRIGIQPQLRVAQMKQQVGHGEGGGRIRIAKLVQFAQRQHAVAIGAAHPHATGANRCHLWRHPGKGDVDLHPAGGQVRPRRIAQHDILDPLGAQAHLRQVIIGLDPAPVQFAVDEILGDRRALRPQRDQHQAERTRPDTQPAQPAPANFGFAVLVFHLPGQPRLSLALQVRNASITSDPLEISTPEIALPAKSAKPSLHLPGNGGSPA